MAASQLRQHGTVYLRSAQHRRLPASDSVLDRHHGRTTGWNQLVFSTSGYRVYI